MYLASNLQRSALQNVEHKIQKWVLTISNRTRLINGILYYSDEFLHEPDHLRVFVPSNTQLQRHLLQAYHNSAIGMHSGRDATYNALSYDFYWRNIAKNVRNWIRRCPQCIRFKTLNQPHGPMQIRLYEQPFHTLGIDNVGELPKTAAGNKWILTIVCPYSNFLRAVPVPDKTATTAAHAFLHNVAFLFGFPTVLQSDRGGEFLNTLSARLTTLLLIKQVFTSGYRPPLNGVTECAHRFLNSALGIYCEQNQDHWEEYLQPAVYSHNTSPISGTTDITPFFLTFGRHAPSPETISLDLPPSTLPADQYAQHLISRMKEAHAQFQSIKADLKRRQRENYDMASRNLFVPDGKIVYMRKESPSQITGTACRFDGPFVVTGHPHQRTNLLYLRNMQTGEDFPRRVNIEKIVVVPVTDSNDLHIPEDALIQPDTSSLADAVPSQNSPHAQVALEFAPYLQRQPSKSAISSKACKFVYEKCPPAREILARYGRLKGLINSCSYLQLDGGSYGGTYVISLNQEQFGHFNR